MIDSTRRALTVLLTIGASVAFLSCAPQGDSAEGTGEGGDMSAESAPRESSDDVEPSREGEGEHVEGGDEHEGGEHSENGEGGEHGEAGHDEGGGAGEESGEYIGIGEGWDATRNGAHLTMSYDPGYDVFMGRVVNTTESKLCAVRVEVHLGDGPELGPTERKDVPPGGSIAVELPVDGTSFTTWTAHSELSPCSE